jgi:hypothetical protein
LVGPIKITAMHRSLADAIGLAQRGDFDRLPASDAALAAMATELKALRKKITILYAGTALLAFFILAQGTSANIDVDLFGLRMPLSVLSKQALAVFLAGAFAYYAAALISFGLLYGLVAAILTRAAPEGWQYLLARYDADHLWTNLLFPKKLGYPSAIGERRIAVIVHSTNTAVVCSHIALVFGAIISSGAAAVNSASYFGMALASLALIAASGAVVGALCALYLPLEYGPPKNKNARSEQVGDSLPLAQRDR